MNEAQPAGAMAAFDLLLDELERDMESYRQAGAVAFAAGNLDQASALLSRLRELETLLARVRAFRTEIAAVYQPAVPPVEHQVSRNAVLAPVLPSDRMPPNYYLRYRPVVMSVLDRLGGRASVQDVLDGVYTVIKPDLTTVDYIPWPSDPRHPRWESRVRNCIGRLRENIY